MKMRVWFLFLGLAMTVCGLGPAWAGVVGRAAREAAEQLGRRLGRGAASEGVGALAGRVEARVSRQGDDVVRAVRKAGPGAVPLIEAAGAHGGQVAGLLARHGEDAAWLAAHPRGLALCREHGDDAAQALIRHRQVAEPAIAALGRPAARALAAVSPRNARRLAMMVEMGTMTRIGRAGELLEVVGRYGDRAMDFVWAHKGALAVAATLAAFLADPGPFLDGARDLAGVAASAAVRPVAGVPGRVAGEVARRLDWTLVVMAALGLAAAGIALDVRRTRRAPDTARPRR